MPVKKKRKIVCKYCGYHMDAGKTRCPFCGSYVNPEMVTAEDYSFHNIKERLSGKRKDVPGAIYIMERSANASRKIVKCLIIFVIFCTVIGGGVLGGRKLYQTVMSKINGQSADAENTALSETVIGSLTVIYDGGVIKRVGPSMSAEADGMAENGTAWSVYETADAEGYHWYRIDSDSWLPDNGTWVIYSQAGGTENE